MGGDDHRCEWRERAEALEAELRAELPRASSPRCRPRSRSCSATSSASAPRRCRRVAEAIRDPARAEAERIAALQTRRENAEKKRQLVTRKIEHKVREDQKICPKCGGHDFTHARRRQDDGAVRARPRASSSASSTSRRSCRCRCGETILTADGADEGLRQGALRPDLHGAGRGLEVRRLAAALPAGEGVPARRRRR